MKTKTFFASIAILLLACTATFAATKQERKVDAFSKISIGSAFKVYLSQGSTQSVAVEVDDEYINDVQTTVANGTLHVNLKNNKSENRNIEVMNVYITIPTIDGIMASGAAKFLVETPISSNGTVQFDLSGAASIKDVTLSCKQLEVELSGAGKCSISVTAEEVEVDASGAANLTLSGKTDKLSVDGSGASRVDVSNLKYSSSDIDVSVAARIKK